MRQNRRYISNPSGRIFDLMKRFPTMLALQPSIVLILPYIAEYLIVELRSMQYTTATLTSWMVSNSSKSSEVDLEWRDKTAIAISSDPLDSVKQ